MLNKVTFQATFIALCTMLSTGAYAIADAPKLVDIPAGELSVALLKLSKQYGADLVYRPEQVHGFRTHGAHGSLTTEQAATRLLQGTPLELRTDSSGAMLIAPTTAGSAQDNSPLGASNAARNSSDDSQEVGKKSSQGFRLAQLDQGASGANSSLVGNAVSPAEPSPRLAEVVVTAQKRSEHLQDVPVPVGVINADSLEENNQTLLRDYYTSVPGFNVTPQQQSAQFLSIRGITTGDFSDRTVGILIDDVPFGGATSTVVPDIDPGDLSRIEVLRGPQGTLYGADSLGGLVKYVTKDPTMDQVSGRIEGGTSDVYNGAEPGFNFRASANIPLSDTVAIRASTYTRQDPGYVDNPVLHIRGINEAESYGGRVAGLWQPSDEFTLKVSATYQDTKGSGLPDVDRQPGLQDLQQDYIPGVGAYDRKVQAYSLTIKDRLGSVELTSLTGYNSLHLYDSLDYSSFLAAETLTQFGVTGSALHDYGQDSTFSQELRASLPLGPKVEALVGAYFSHNTNNQEQRLTAEDATTGEVVGQWLYGSFPSTFQEIAAFVDVTYEITDRIDVQLGGRESRYTIIEPEEFETGPLLGGTAVYTPSISTKGDAFTYLVTPRFKLSSDVMVYARIASGYRPGSPNTAISIQQGAPVSSNADKTQNYEVGVKADFLDHRVSIDTSLYYVAWKDIQLQLNTPQDFSYEANGSNAKSEGIEIAVTTRPFRDLTISGWIATDNAVLTKGFPADATVLGNAGDRLPDSSRFSGNLSFEQRFPIVNNVTGFIGGDASYVDAREDVFVSAPPRLEFPPYTKADLHAGFKSDNWSTNVYVNNVTDTRGVLDRLQFTPQAYIYLTPRTVGVSVSRTF
jgi:iron complex outermembrane receptor protein